MESNQLINDSIVANLGRMPAIQRRRGFQARFNGQVISPRGRRYWPYAGTLRNALAKYMCDYINSDDFQNAFPEEFATHYDRTYWATKRKKELYCKSMMTQNVIPVQIEPVEYEE